MNSHELQKKIQGVPNIISIGYVRDDGTILEYKIAHALNGDWELVDDARELLTVLINAADGDKKIKKIRCSKLTYRYDSSEDYL